MVTISQPLIMVLVLFKVVYFVDSWFIICSVLSVNSEPLQTSILCEFMIICADGGIGAIICNPAFSGENILMHFQTVDLPNFLLIPCNIPYHKCSLVNNLLCHCTRVPLQTPSQHFSGISQQLIKGTVWYKSTTNEHPQIVWRGPQLMQFLLLLLITPQAK